MSELSQTQGVQQGPPSPPSPPLQEGCLPPDKFNSSFTFHAPVNKEGILQENSCREEYMHHNTLEGEKVPFVHSGTIPLL